MANETTLPADLNALPLLPLRDVVVFPHMVIPLFVGRPKSIKALDLAMEAGKHILLVAQKQAAKDDPSAEDLNELKRSILLTIAKLDLRQDEPGSDSLADVA